MTSGRYIGHDCQGLGLGGAFRLWEIAENLHRAELGPVERAEHIDEWRKLTVAKETQGGADGAPLGGRQPHEKGIAKTAEALGVSDATVRRAEKISALPQETPSEVASHIARRMELWERKNSGTSCPTNRGAGISMSGGS